MSLKQEIGHGVGEWLTESRKGKYEEVKDTPNWLSLTVSKSSNHLIDAQ